MIRLYFKILAFILLTQNLIAMDIKTFYKLDIEATKITIIGAKKTLSKLKENASNKDIFSTLDETQKQIQELYKKENTTPSKALGYYMEHKVEADNYYKKNKELQEEYKRLKSKLESITTQIDTLKEERNK